MGEFSLDLRMHEILGIVLGQPHCWISMKRTRAKIALNSWRLKSFNSMLFSSGERSGQGMLRVEV